MKNKRFFFVAVLLCGILSATALFGQSAPVDLGFALSNGLVSLSVSGNGNCAGHAVEGTIKNHTPTTISIDVNIIDALYLVNSGKGQNMLATKILPSTLISLTDGISKFFKIEADASVGIVFEAYCADYEKDNPSIFERFHVSVTPTAVATIGAKIGRYNAINVNADLTKAKQIALWRDQGRSWREIAEKIDFTSVEWEVSTEIMNFTP